LTETDRSKSRAVAPGFLRVGLGEVWIKEGWSGRRESNPYHQLGRLAFKSGKILYIQCSNRYYHMILQVICRKRISGAGGGNRTRVISLEG
jgi:hypothetical protein